MYVLTLCLICLCLHVLELHMNAAYLSFVNSFAEDDVSQF